MHELPANPGNCTLGALNETWLSLFCPACRRTVISPLKLLGQRHGRNKRLRDVTRRFICADCGKRPTVYLQESATYGASGMGDADHGWRVKVPGKAL